MKKLLRLRQEAKRTATLLCAPAGADPEIHTEGK
jgi:hypothetical protein